MKAIMELNGDELIYFSDMQQRLRLATAGSNKNEWFDDFKKSSGYAHYTFSGVVTDKLVEMLGHEPGADEIIILVDSGFSHFGAQCYVKDRVFSGRVNID